VFCQVLVLNESFAGRTLRSFDSALLDVVAPTFNLEDLLAVVAWLWTQLTPLLMISKFQFACFKSAELALNVYVCLFFVILLVRLGNNHAALSALVVDACALDFVHAELARLNAPLAVFAHFGLLGFNHLNYLLWKFNEEWYPLL
jgi:phosphatidylserine synthase